MNILITGANRGIGAGLLASYRAAGHSAEGTARNGDKDLLPLDLTDPDAAAQLAASRPAPLDLLICNAGVYRDKGQTIATGYPPELWAESFATNVTGVFLMVQAFLP